MRVLLLLSLAMGGAHASLNMCGSYLQGCLLFGSSTGCTSPVTAYGCAQSSTVNGTLDLLAADVAQGGTARCGCSAPYSLSTGANPWNGPSSRVAEKLVETLVAASGGVALVSATAGATTAPWDYYRSASALCTTAMQGAGCGPGLLYASNPAQSPNNFVCQCKSGADVAHVYDATLRVEQLVVDAVTNNYSAWSYTANGYLCDNFVGVCNSALTAFGCAATNINGCGSSTPGGALTAFVGSCGCNSPWTSPTSPTPASPSDVIGNRVMENIISNALPPNVVPLFLQYTTGPSNSLVVDPMASFGAVCNAVMQAFNCPAGNNASSYAPGNALSCTCGSFNPTNAVIALVQDAVLANFYNATLAGAQPVSIVAATCAPATAGDPRTTGLTAAVVILALLLAGALAYIIYPFCGARDTSRMIGGSRATQRMKMNPAASVIEA